MVLGDDRKRIELLKTRWELREKYGEEIGLRKLTEEEKSWCKKQTGGGENDGIYPEVLAICTDAYFEAREKLLKLQKKKGERFLRYLRPDLYLYRDRGEVSEAQLQVITIDDLLMNPGGMAELVCTESDSKIPAHRDQNGQIVKYPRYALSNIGSVAAKPQLKTNKAVESEKNVKDRVEQETSLTELISLISQDTQKQAGQDEPIILKYNEHRVPGSQAGEGDVRGGALGVQFMPATALTEYKFHQENFDAGFNPFGLDAVVGIYVVIARGVIQVNQKTGERYGPRNGYLRGNGEFGRDLRYYAIDKWNQQPDQTRQILRTAESYYDHIMDGGFFDRKVVPIYNNKKYTLSPLYNQAA